MDRLDNRRISYMLLAQLTEKALTPEMARVARLEVGPEETAESLGKNFTYYFRGVYRGNFGLPAYESVWRRSKWEQISYPALMEVRNFLSKCGIRATAKDQPDFISTEFGVMAWLIAKQEDTGDPRYVQWQREWLSDHMLKWIPDFCRHLKESCPSTAYQSLAEYIVALLDEEKEEEVK